MTSKKKACGNLGVSKLKIRTLRRRHSQGSVDWPRKSLSRPQPCLGRAKSLACFFLVSILALTTGRLDQRAGGCVDRALNQLQKHVKAAHHTSTPTSWQTYGEDASLSELTAGSMSHCRIRRPKGQNNKLDPARQEHVLVTPLQCKITSVRISIGNLFGLTFVMLMLELKQY